MKKIYSIVLMATALLIGTNVWAVEVNKWADLRTELEKGGTVKLSDNINVVYGTDFKSILIGAKNAAGTALAVDGDAPAAAILNLAGHNITITANDSYVAINPFVLTKGSLKVTGSGTIEVTGKLTHSTNVFFVFGADEANKVDPKGSNPFTKLFIDENVTVKTNNGTVIAIDQLTTSHDALKQTNGFSGKGYNTNYMAYGVFVDVKGTLISEGTDYSTKKCYGIKVNGNVHLPADATDKALTPYVHVEPSAVIRSDMRSNLAGSTAIYASGFGQWKIEGNCSGASGVYISSGIVAINDATIKSAADQYVEAAAGTHANGSGSAIVINSRDSRSGDVEVTISGDTKAESTKGYAVEEIVNTKNDNTKVESIAIEGGSFEGGEKGAIVVTSSTVAEATVTVAGGNVQGEANMGDKTLAEYLNNQGGTHATIVTDGSGKTTLVISEGDAPTGEANVAGHAADARINWTGATEALNADVTLAELEINQATEQKLTVNDGVTLTVGRVVLGTKAQIIVEAGAKFIVTGEQGIVAPAENNIVLKNEEGKRSIFLFNPAVTSNRHPNALFEILSYSWRVSATEAQSEVFGIPTHNAIKSVSCLDAGKYGYLQVYDKGDWANIAFTDDTPFPYDKLNKPFAAYALTAYRGQADPKLTFQFGGELVGNVDATLTANMKWSFFANSYTAEVDLAKFLTGLETTAQNVDKYIYVSNLNGHGYWHWESLGIEEVVEDHVLTKLQPMQGFLLNNTGGHVESNGINYESMVYDPYFPSTSPAPRRMAANNNTAKMYVVVTNEVGAYDNVKLRETENTKSAEKFMNQDVNIYATAEEKSAILAAENLADTYVGFSTVKGGNFTISFTNVMGREFDLVDLETGARVAVAEGFEYNFTADANYANDYRFKIVERHFAPTGIENTEAVKNAKGIFTITGQYVGEMNVWNTLPAGVYVVNGEKRVK